MAPLALGSVAVASLSVLCEAGAVVAHKRARGCGRYESHLQRCSLVAERGYSVVSFAWFVVGASSDAVSVSQDPHSQIFRCRVGVFVYVGRTFQALRCAAE